MTRKFCKWAKKEHISSRELAKSLIEVINGQFDANLGGYIYKKNGLPDPDKEKAGVFAV